jgi:hypothetical protein
MDAIREAISWLITYTFSPFMAEAINATLTEIFGTLPPLL